MILGFDIFLDEKLKPWLIEVNNLPSFQTDSPLDKKIKYDIIYETIALLNLTPYRKNNQNRVAAFKANCKKNGLDI